MTSKKFKITFPDVFKIGAFQKVDIILLVSCFQSTLQFIPRHQNIAIVNNNLFYNYKNC